MAASPRPQIEIPLEDPESAATAMPAPPRSGSVHPPSSSAQTDLVAWLHARRRTCDMTAVEIPWRESREWLYDGGRVRHRTGAFFSVVGAAVLRHERQPGLDQPLIHQPEIGILGFVVTHGATGPEVIVQLKPEPGNVHLVQAAPTVQATESNYRRRHNGKATPFLEHFLSGAEARVLSDSLQSEQGTRFLGKYNRNVMVWIPRSPALEESQSLRCFPMSDLLELLTQHFLINTDARSVLMSGPWKFMAANGEPFSRWRGQDDFGAALRRSYNALEDTAAHTRAELLERLEGMRRSDAFHTEIVSLTDLAGWELSEAGISGTQPDAFSIRQFEVSTTEREVDHWDQPLVASPTQGLAVLLCQERAGVLHFLFNCQGEIGFRERYQYGPTILDAGAGSTARSERADQLWKLKEHADNARVLLSCLHSDEGGRFYRCESSYTISMVDSSQHIELDRNLSWMTLAQIEELATLSGVFSNEARSLVSMLLAYL